MAEPTDKTNDYSNLQLLRRIAVGLLVAGAASFGGWPVIIAAGLVTTALYSYQEYRTKKNHQKTLLELYRKDLAALYDKSPESLTLDDLYKAGKPVEKGGLGIVTLQKQLVSDNHDRGLRIISEALSSLLITTALIICRSHGILLFPEGPLSTPHITFGALVGGAFAVSHRFIDSIMEKWFGTKGTNDEPINTRIAGIAQQATRQPLQSVEVFSVLVAANPELQNAIKAQNGNAYDELPVKVKQKAMQSYDSVYRTEALTQAINAGEIKPSFLGFLAYGQVSENLPDYRKYRQLFSSVQSITEEPAEERTKHVERLLSEEKKTGPGRVVH